jgi:hypothetical protein
MSRGIYSDRGPDCTARASKSGQMSWMVGRTDGRAGERLDRRTEKRTERLEKWLERGFP